MPPGATTGWAGHLEPHLEHLEPHLEHLEPGRNLSVAPAPAAARKRKPSTPTIAQRRKHSLAAPPSPPAAGSEPAVLDRKDPAPPSSQREPEALDTPYVFAEPPPKLNPADHFSSILLMSGDGYNTAVELGLLVAITTAVCCLPNTVVDVNGSMPLSELCAMLWASAIVNRLYTSYLEAVYFCFPKYRTQPPHEHTLRRARKDLSGRELGQLEQLNWHDRMTLLSQFALNLGLYYTLPGYYPSAAASHTWPERAGRLLLNHYVLSFGMYWMHRLFHTNKFLWSQVHSVHHWARHPLSRNTYEDHWVDNFCGAIFGHFFAQVLVPLDGPTFWFSHLFRIFESLEKHSGVSCSYNLAHSAQRWLPYAQMPHHHDWHHEGHKSCNFTFTAIGGAWDCIFGTRKVGRAVAGSVPLENAGTRADRAGDTKKRVGAGALDEWAALVPLVVLAVFVGLELYTAGGTVPACSWGAVF